MDEMKFTVLGEPQGKGRPRFGGKTKTGATITRTPDRTVLYENLIVTEYRRQIGDIRFEKGVPLQMTVTAYYRIPASISKQKRRDITNGLIVPTKKPDWDNIGKVVADALNGVAYYDDAQIVEGCVQKFFSEQPRIEVKISEWIPIWEKRNDE